MFAVINSGALIGIELAPIRIEVDITQGMPGLTVVGLPDNAVKESKERVAAAIRNSGMVMPLKRITVNLAPADIKKEGSAFDLPIALGILAASGQVNPDKLNRYMVVGELSLEGDIRPIKGALSVALGTKEASLQGIILPKENALEASVVDGVQVKAAIHLRQLVEYLKGGRELEEHKTSLQEVYQQSETYDVDLNEVYGQEHAKRALEIAAAGGHNVLMVGPPGAGKTMLARRLPTILPDLSLAEALETTRIHSAAGMLKKNQALVITRPFRAPHHTISYAGLIGGGHFPRPGEVSIAHNGVLFLDELAEFETRSLEVLRQPLEDGIVTISRAVQSLTFPASFMLIASMNPCPCGFYTDPTHNCTCSAAQIHRYLAKISGPLLDRIDLQIEVPSVPTKDLIAKHNAEPSVEVRKRVVAARNIQLQRFKNTKIFSNAQMANRYIKNFCRVDEQGENLLKDAINKLGFSARAYMRIIRVAQTIADLDNAETIRTQHIAEAIQYRSLDKLFHM